MASIEALERAVADGCDESVGSGKPEAVLRARVQPVLASILAARGLRAFADNEAFLAVPAAAEAEELDAPLESQGRADAVYNRFVIEFEPPGALRQSVMHRATRHALTQVKQYLRGVATREGLALQRLAGCAFDGRWIAYVTWESGEWRETRPRPVDREALEALVAAIASLATGRGLTADNLDYDYGRESGCARELVPVLFSASRSRSDRTEAMYRQWTYDIGVASGPFSPGDLAEWALICDELGLPPGAADASRALFALQTYFSIVAKLIALIILEGATGRSLVQELVSEDVFAAYLRLESGRLTQVTGALNVVEPGVLSWYVHERRDDLARGLRRAAGLAEEYSAEIVEVTPLAVRDVLKDLYQRLLPASIRHRLGEYYTPDWLASYLVDLTLTTPTPFALTPETRVVDPACGSGTFLVEVVNRQVSAAPPDAREQTLRHVLRNVVGFDISPLAVQAAKVNYLLALAPVLRGVDVSFVIPVFMADAVSPPRRGNLFEGDVFVFESSEGSWELPTVVVEHGQLLAVGEIIGRAVAEETPRRDVEALLRRRLPQPCNRQTTVSKLGELYAKLLELHELDRNGMWWQILGNAFAPILQGTFDLALGNPPWVSWETLPEPYRRANDSQWLVYGLRPDVPPDRRQASQQVPLDLAMLFVSRTMDKLVRPGGRLGFVVTASVFKSELAGRGFRRFRLIDGRYRLSRLEDLSRLKVFAEAANQTALMVAEREEGDSFPVRLVEWAKTAAGPGSIPTSWPVSKVLEATARVELLAEPVSPNDPGSPLVALPEPALELTREIRRASPYLERVRKGIDTRGANGVFFLHLLARRGGLVHVRNDVEAGRDRTIPVVERWIEAGAVRSLLRGADVQRSGATPAGGLMFFHDNQHVSHPLHDAAAARRYPAAYAYAQNFEGFLRARRKFRNFDPSGEDWLGMYSVTQAAICEHKVVYREIAAGIIAAAIHSAAVIPDHKLYVVACETRNEADWLAEVLNSPLVDQIGRAFTLATSISGSLLRYIGIRQLDGNRPETADRRLEVALGLRRPQIRLLNESLGLLERALDA